MPVELTRIEEFALITLNRPEALNALSVQVVKDIGAAIDEAAASDARALLITGAGEKAFCAGADISEFMGRNIVEAIAATELGQNTFAKLDSLTELRTGMRDRVVRGGLTDGAAFTQSLEATYREAWRTWCRYD